MKTTAVLSPRASSLHDRALPVSVSVSITQSGTCKKKKKTFRKIFGAQSCTYDGINTQGGQKNVCGGKGREGEGGLIDWVCCEEELASFSSRMSALCTTHFF